MEKRKKISKKVWIAVGCLLFAVLCGALLLLKDIVGYYGSYQYVRLNYNTSGPQLVDVDITIPVDLTKEAQEMELGDGLKLAGGSAGLFYSTYDNQEVYKVAAEKPWDKNYTLTFFGYMDGNFKKCSVVLPVDEDQYFGELHQNSNNTGVPATKVPVEGMKVIAGGQEYTPMAYVDDRVGADFGGVCTIGLFSEPEIYNQLIEQGITTATVKISKLWKTEYTMPSISSVFEKREKFDAEDYVVYDDRDYSRPLSTKVYELNNVGNRLINSDGTAEICGRFTVFKNFEGSFYIEKLEPMVTNADQLEQIFDYTTVIELDYITSVDLGKYNHEYDAAGAKGEFLYWEGNWDLLKPVQLPFLIDDSCDEMQFYIRMKGDFNNVGNWEEEDDMPFYIYGIKITTDTGEVYEVTDERWRMLYEE